MNNVTRILSEPCYYHLEYANNLSSSLRVTACLSSKNFDRLNRATNISLLLSTLYQPLYFPASVGLGTMRAVSNMLQLVSSIQNENNIGSQAVQTSFAVASLAGTVFMHPLGMLLTTAQDLYIDVSKLALAMEESDYKKAIEISASIISNGMYMTLFFHGGAELAITSLCMHILIEAYRAHIELKEGHYTAAAEHITLAALRGVQLNRQMKVFEVKKKVEALKPQVALQQSNIATLKSSKMIAKSWFWESEKDPYTGAGKPTKGAKTGLLGIAFIILGALVTPICPVAGGAIIATGAGTLTDGIITHSF